MDWSLVMIGTLTVLVGLISLFLLWRVPSFISHQKR
jgi:hypothetical protein